MNEPLSRIRPIIILPKGQMGVKDMERLRENGICVVECKDPSAVRFTEPPVLSLGTDYTPAEYAAIELSRQLLTDPRCDWREGHQSISAKYVAILIKGHSLKATTQVEKTTKA